MIQIARTQIDDRTESGVRGPDAIASDLDNIGMDLATLSHAILEQYSGMMGWADTEDDERTARQLKEEVEALVRAEKRIRLMSVLVEQAAARIRQGLAAGRRAERLAEEADGSAAF